MRPADGIEQKPPRPPRTLRRAVRRLRWGQRIALWAAPSGPSRQGELDAALALLSRRFHVVRIPYGAMPAGEICALALAALDRGMAGDPERALLEAVAARRGGRERLLIAIDEADHMPLVEARRLRELTRRAQGSLRLLLVSSVGPDEERLRDALEERSPRRPPRPPTPQPQGVLRRLRPAAPPAQPAPPPPRETRPDGLRRPTPYPYRAAEHALEALAQRVLAGSPLVALVGPPGLGKTMVMRRLAAKVGEPFDPVWVPGLALPADQLLRWMLYCRTGSAAAADPREAWRQEVARAHAVGRILLVLLDDAGALRQDAANALSEEIAWAEGRLRIAMSLCEGRYREGEGADQLPLERVRLDAPLSPIESMDFLRAQLGASPDAAWLARVVEEARGVPAALLRGTSVWLARRAALLRHPAPSTGG